MVSNSANLRVLYNNYDLSAGQPLLQLSAINPDGTGLTPLRSAPATWPARASAGAIPPPRLAVNLTPDGNQLVVSWPAAAGNLVLESSGEPGLQANWQGVATQPVASGGQQSVTVSTRGGAQFFRLRKP